MTMMLSSSSSSSSRIMTMMMISSRHVGRRQGHDFIVNIHAVANQWLSSMSSSSECRSSCHHRHPYQRQTRPMSSGGSNTKKGLEGNKQKSQAMKRQRDWNATSTSSSKSSSSSRQQRKEVATDKVSTASSTLPPSSGYHSTSSSGSMSQSHNFVIGGPVQLDLQPTLNRYLMNNNEDSSSSSSSSSSLAWESNKKTAFGGSGTDRLTLNKNNCNNNNIELSVDHESMFDPTIHLPHAPQQFLGQNYEPATPLSDFLMQRIGVSGQPITTAEYMRHALTHPLYGYYTKKSSTVDDWDDDQYDDDSIDGSTRMTPHQSAIFGRGGDFVTAPELSSVFGHSLCVWFMTVWQQPPLQRPSSIQLLEFGPGRGTLMADVLELAHSSKLVEFGRSIKSLHFIETSKQLRQEQKQTLQTKLSHLIQFNFVGEEEENNKNDEETADSSGSTQGSFVNTMQVEWHDDLASFQNKRNKTIPTMMILQEFLDALPVHQFQKTEDGWMERMIDVVSVDDMEDNDETFSTKSSPSSEKHNSEKKKKRLLPRLRQVVAPHVTPAVELLLSPNADQYDHFPVGTVVEICPEALFLVQDIAKILQESQGAALIIDYGEEGTGDTLRAFSKHEQVPLTTLPGMVDVTADVDFFALKSCLSGNNKRFPSISEVHAFGPVPQGEFLMKMGAGELTTNAILKPETTEEQAQAMADALKYLVMPEHMGTKFKVLALARKRDGLFGPAGME